MTGLVHRLFAYGTLVDPEIQRRVLRAEAPASGARLSGFELRQADGYYFARRQPTESISGVVLELSEAQLVRADRWEEVPVYRRVRVVVELEDSAPVDAWVYVREDVDGEPVSTPGIATLSRERILAGLEEDA